MAVAAKVIQVNVKTAQEVEDAINDALTDFPIEALQYLESLTIAFSEKNQQATIVIFYDGG